MEFLKPPEFHDQDQKRLSIGMITAAAVTIVLACIVGLAQLVDMPFRDQHGVVGWVSTHRYPKYQDLLFYFSSLGLVVLAVFVACAIWSLLSRLLSRFLSVPACAVGTLVALGSLPLHLVWMRMDLLTDRPRLWLFILACSSTAAAASLIVLEKKRPFVKKLWWPRLPVSKPVVTGGHKLIDQSGYRIIAWIIVWLVAPVLVYVGLYSGPIGRGTVDMLHEGEILAPLTQLQHGGVPFTDIYVQTGLLFNVYPGYLGAVLFEPSLSGVRLMWGLLFPLGAVSLYYLGAVALRSSMLGAVALVAVVAVWPGWISPRVTFGMAAIALVMSSIHGTRHLRLLNENGTERAWAAGVPILLAGVCTAFAFWHSVEISLFTFAAIGVTLFGISFLQPGVAKHRRVVPLVTYVVGVALGLAPVLVYFAAHNALPDLLRNVYEQLALHDAIWGRAYARLSAVLESLLSQGAALTPWSLLAGRDFNWFFPPLFFMLCIAYLCYRWLDSRYWSSTTCVRFTLAVLAAVLYFVTALGRSAPNHLIFGSVMFYLPLFMATEWGVTRVWRGITASGGYGMANRLWSLLPLAPVAFTVAYLSMYSISLGAFEEVSRNLQKMRVLKLDADVRIDNVPKKQMRHIRQVVDYIHRNSKEGDTLFDFSNQPAYLYFANRKSPTRYFMVAYAGSMQQQKQVIQDLEHHRTPLVIYRAGARDRIDGIDNRERHRLIADYLLERYREADVIDGVTVLKRKDLP